MIPSFVHERACDILARSNHLDGLLDIANDTSILPNCQEVYWIGFSWDHACTEALTVGNLQLADFRALNPTINEDCTNFQVGVSYCIRGRPKHENSPTSNLSLEDSNSPEVLHSSSYAALKTSNRTALQKPTHGALRISYQLANRSSSAAVVRASSFIISQIPTQLAKGSNGGRSFLSTNSRAPQASTKSAKGSKSSGVLPSSNYTVLQTSTQTANRSNSPVVLHSSSSIASQISSQLEEGSNGREVSHSTSYLAAQSSTEPAQFSNQPAGSISSVERVTSTMVIVTSLTTNIVLSLPTTPHSTLAASASHPHTKQDLTSSNTIGDTPSGFSTPSPDSSIHTLSSSLVRSSLDSLTSSAQSSILIPALPLKALAGSSSTKLSSYTTPSSSSSLTSSRSKPFTPTTYTIFGTSVPTVDSNQVFV